jgi:hypothetical protein
MLSSMDFWQGIPARALLRDKLEDRFTEYLAQLLLAEQFLAPFAETFCNIRDRAAGRVETWCSVPGGYPDLILRFEDTLLLFEAKVDSCLHQQQLVPYANHLSSWAALDQSRRACLFTLTRAAAKESCLETARAQLRDANVDGIELRAISWEEIAALCRAVATAPTIEGRLRAHLEDFARLVSMSTGKPIEGFTESEVRVLEDRSTGAAFYRAWQLLDAIITALPAHTSVAIGSFNSSSISSNSYYGYGLDDNRFWFGFWPAAWSEVGESPLFLSIESREARENGRTVSAVRRFRHPGDGKERLVIPISIPADAPFDATADRMAHVIAQHLKTLGAGS